MGLFNQQYASIYKIYHICKFSVIAWKILSNSGEGNAIGRICSLVFVCAI